MIFILGGKGFIGSAFSRVCAADGRPHAVIDRRNYDEYKGIRCEVLVNAAGNSRKYFSKKAPVEDFDLSVRSVRSSLVDFDYGSYVLLSSADVYPDCRFAATTPEDQDLEVAHQSPYGFHKYLAELCVRHAAPNWLIIRGGGFVGPGLKKNPIYDILRGDKLWVAPESEFQYIHTEEAASIVLSLLDQGRAGEVFNLCGRGVVRLNDVLGWVGRDVSIQPDSTVVRCELNLDKLGSLVDLPETGETLQEFVGREIGRIETGPGLA